MLNVFATVLTNGGGVAANNRGETVGNITTMPKCVINGEVYTLVSGEAIRAALRHRAQVANEKIYRKFNPSTGEIDFDNDNKKHSVADYFDDDVFGWMETTKSKGTKGEDGDVDKGSCNKRTAALCVTRAVSLTPWDGFVSYSCQNSGKGKGELSLYGTEMHSTQYQFTLAVAMNQIHVKTRVPALLDYLVDIAKVGGNHSRYLYDFSPESIVYRVTEDQSPRVLGCFGNDEGKPSLSRLVDLIDSGDVPASEVIVGGLIARGEDAKRLRELSVAVFTGVKAATAEVKLRISGVTASVQTNGVHKTRRTVAAR